MAQEPEVAATASGGGEPPVLRDRYEIDPAKPLPGLDMPNAHAFRVTDKRNGQRALYALVCDGPLPPRTSAMRTLRGVSAPGLVPLIEWGVVDWPPVDGRCVAVVYERPLGGRLMKSENEVFQPVPDQSFAKIIWRPLIAGLTELQGRSIAHRAIRPTNLYWMDREQTRIALGDCTTSPPAYDQPVGCETIESGMASREGRGGGYYPDDMYALGATLVIASVGSDPLAGVAPEAIVSAKIANGSYSTVVGDERVPLGVIELVRGLLVDDQDQRWSLESIELWSNGRRMNPMQTRQEKRAQRPFVFRGAEYYTRRALAHALSQDWESGVQPIMEGKVETWLRRGLELGDLADSVGNVVRAANVTAKDAGPVRDMAVAAVLILMDPRAPVRYGKVRVHMEAFGTAMACTLAMRGDIRPYIDLIQRDITKTWIAAQEAFSSDFGRFDAEFKDLRTYLVQTSKGGGIERCLYEMNESLPCRSALLRNQCVLEIGDLLPALEWVAVKADQKQSPADRHVVAFVAARYPKDTMGQIHALNDEDPRKAALGVLSLLAVLQWKLGPESLPGLAAWLGSQMAPAINSYHSREKRKRIEKELPKVVRKGSLPDLYFLLDDSKERQLDLDGFLAARQQYAQAAQQVAALESGNYRVSETSERLGQQTAASVSVAIAIVTIVFVSISRLI
ncbi:hypothetical protein CKO38_06350 [Rhodospirillum rubrum]|uniref:protein kinase family protein n=1 Tax=Rhodospirillum rubrum TaxID=1085 RepID=UPI001904DE2F|nr:protein kinase family protein [Rhodospirillum rubrum]MBK1664867.1 hypothetical protein [Rhodospirillum rubrum]MBK1676300.1 hypothetical protein [Rhodospirillum rubrum]